MNSKSKIACISMLMILSSISISCANAYYDEFTVDPNRIDRYYIPQGRTHDFKIRLDGGSSTYTYVEFWIYLPEDNGVPIWETDLLEAVPEHPSGTHEGPTYISDGWYFCKIEAPPGQYFDSEVHLRFTVTTPGTLGAETTYTLVKFNSTKIGFNPKTQTTREENLRTSTIRFYVEPWSSPSDTPITLYDSDSPNVKYTLDITPKNSHVPVFQDQKWNIKSELEVLEDGVINHLALYVGLISEWVEECVEVDENWYLNYPTLTSLKITFVNSSGTYPVHDTDFVPYNGLDSTSYASEDIDNEDWFGVNSWGTGLDYDDRPFIAWYDIYVENIDSFFSKGDKVIIEFSLHTPGLGPDVTPQELVKIEFRTRMRWAESWPRMLPRSYPDRNVNVYFDTGLGFVVPEYPFGTFGVVLMLGIALGFFALRRSR